MVFFMYESFVYVLVDREFCLGKQAYKDSTENSIIFSSHQKNELPFHNESHVPNKALTLRSSFFDVHLRFKIAFHNESLFWVCLHLKAQCARRAHSRVRRAFLDSFALWQVRLWVGTSLEKPKVGNLVGVSLNWSFIMGYVYRGISFTICFPLFYIFDCL